MVLACGIHKKNKVFDKDVYFLEEIYEGNNPQIIANNFFDGDIDKLDTLCHKENCFKEAN